MNRLLKKCLPHAISIVEQAICGHMGGCLVVSCSESTKPLWVETPASSFERPNPAKCAWHGSYPAITRSYRFGRANASTAGVVKGRELRLRCAACRSSWQSSALCISIWLEGSVKRLAKFAHNPQTCQSLSIYVNLNSLLLALGHPQTPDWGDLEGTRNKGWQVVYNLQRLMSMS